MQVADRLVSLLARGALPEHSSDKPCHRFHGRIHRTVCLRGLRRPPADLAPGVRARRLRSLQDHLRQPGSNGAEESRARHSWQFRESLSVKTLHSRSPDFTQQTAYAQTAECPPEPKVVA